MVGMTPLCQGSGMQNTTSQVLYQYWNDVRGARLAPRRFEIEPALFSAILPETFMIECEPGQGHRFRLAGTRIGEKLGYELRGRDFTDLLDGEDHVDLKPILEAVTQQGAVGLIDVDLPSISGRSARFEIIMLPLVHTEERITRMLGAISTVNHEPWLGSEQLIPGRIATSEVVWPDGRPFAVARQMAHANPFRSDFARSRLVRSQRRVFRVYEGGR